MAFLEIDFILEPINIGVTGISLTEQRLIFLGFWYGPQITGLRTHFLKWLIEPGYKSLGIYIEPQVVIPNFVA